MSESQHLLVATRPRQQGRNIWISAGVIAIVHSRFDSHGSLAEEAAQVLGLPRREGKTKQRRTSLNERPTVISPGIDPLPPILQVRILGEGIDGPESPLPRELPLDSGGIFRSQN